MSAILDALRKLEDNSTRLHPWSMRIRTAGSGSRGKKFFRLLALLPPLGALVFAGYFYLKNPPHFSHRLNAVFDAYRAAGRAPLQADSTKPEVSAPPAAVLQPAVSTGEDALPKAAPSTDAPLRKAVAAPDIRPAQKIFAKAPTREASSQPKSPSAQALPVEGADRLQPVPLSNPSPTAPSKPGVQTVPEEQFLPIFNDPTVMLQAIAWSKDPGQRMAVVNGLILREGDSVAGVTITKIREEEVIIREGAQTMKIMFQGR